MPSPVLAQRVAIFPTQPPPLSHTMESLGTKVDTHPLALGFKCLRNPAAPATRPGPSTGGVQPRAAIFSRPYPGSSEGSSTPKGRRDPPDKGLAIVSGSRTALLRGPHRHHDPSPQIHICTVHRLPRAVSRSTAMPRSRWRQRTYRSAPASPARERNAAACIT